MWLCSITVMYGYVGLCICNVGLCMVKLFLFSYSFSCHAMYILFLKKVAYLLTTVVRAFQTAC